MSFVRTLASGSLAALMAVAASPLAAAAGPAWQDRCKLDLGSGDFGEEGYLAYQTRTAGEGGVEGRGAMGFNAGAAVNLIEYPTETKGLMSNFSGPKMWIGFFGPVRGEHPGAADFALGYFGVTANARDLVQIPGNVTAQLEIGGKVFGPYVPDPARAEGGSYALWFDTAATDADGRPPIVDEATVKAIADAVSTMDKGAFVLLRDGKPIVRMPLPRPRYQEWLAGLPGFSGQAWSSTTQHGRCPPGSEAEED